MFIFVLFKGGLPTLSRNEYLTNLNASDIDKLPLSKVASPERIFPKNDVKNK